MPGDARRRQVFELADGRMLAFVDVDDYRVFGAPWGFEPADIRLPVHIWQGGADELVPPSWGQRLADAIPDSTLHVEPDASHFLWYDHWDDIFDVITSSATS